MQREINNQADIVTHYLPEAKVLNENVITLMMTHNGIKITLPRMLPNKSLHKIMKDYGKEKLLLHYFIPHHTETFHYPGIQVGVTIHSIAFDYTKTLIIKDTIKTNNMEALICGT